LTTVKGIGPWAALLFRLAGPAWGRHRSRGSGGCLGHRLGRAAGWSDL